MKLSLVIGDKNLSSWSLRAWLVAKYSQLEIQEILVWLDRPETSENLKKFSPSQKVPCLLMGDTQIWDSLAICETIAELAPKRNLWPRDPEQRALARSYTAEMHSGFSSIRNQLSMDIRLRIKIRHLTPDTLREIERIKELWETAVKKSKGPFLFGDFGIVDAFFAPVVFRFQSYGIKFESVALNRYMNSILEMPIVKEWSDAALKEEALDLTF